MIDAIVLDAGPLGMVSHPRRNSAIKSWLSDMVDGGVKVVIPEIADYEVRRELLRVNSSVGILRLDFLQQQLRYLPLTTEVMLRAADLWATARRAGRPTAADAALDADVILAAQALSLDDEGFDVVVATSNARHLAQFVNARDWSSIIL